MNLSERIQAQHQASSTKRTELINLLRLHYPSYTLVMQAAVMLAEDEQEIQGWREDQKENMDNQVQLQKIINGLTCALNRG